MVGRWVTRRWLAKITLLVITLLTLLGGGELFIRSYYDGKFATRPASVVADAQCIWKPAPNLDHTFWGNGWSMRVRTDADGYRLGQLGPVPDDAELIILSGDSYTYGWGVSTQETMASVLDRLVSEASAGHIRVVNLGVPGYATLQSGRRLEQFLRQRPNAIIRAVVLNHCANDASGNASPKLLKCVLGHDRLLGSQPVVRNPSSFHLLNLLRYRAETGVGGGLDNDGATGARWTEEEPPDHFALAGIKFTKIELAEKPNAELMMRLMEAAVKLFHGALAGRDVAVYHASLIIDPEWFPEALSRVVTEAQSDGNNARWLGRVPPPGSFNGSIINAHKGGHFSPGINRHWAETLFKVLQDDGRLER